MDWKDTLSGLRSSLPEGETSDKNQQPSESRTSSQPRLQVFYEKKGRAGKPATIITGYDTEEQARTHASELKRALAVGGSARGKEVLLQGDQRAKLIPLLNPKIITLNS